VAQRGLHPLGGLRRRFLTLLEDEARLERMARIIGRDAMPARQRLTLLCAQLINQAFLRQSAFSEIDRYATPQRQAVMMRLIGSFIDAGEELLEQGVAPERHRRGADLPRPDAHGRGDTRGRLGALLRELDRGADGDAGAGDVTAVDWLKSLSSAAMYARLIGEDIANRVDGPLLFLRRTVDVGLNEAVEVEDAAGAVRLGRIAALDPDSVTVEMLDDTAGLRIDGARVRFFGEPLRFHVGPGLLGRVFNGVGKPLDGGPPLAAQRAFRVDGLPLKPSARQAPSEFLETGFTAIDLMNSLVRGQKLPLFSGGGLPHDRIAVDIACNARLPRGARSGGGGGADGDDDFAIVFAGIGIPHGSAEFFRARWSRAGRWRARCCS
jgi:hypothetical protein